MHYVYHNYSDTLNTFNMLCPLNKAKVIYFTRENNDNECTGKLVQCPITNKFYRQLADNKPTNSAKSDPDFHAHSNTQSDHSLLKQQPTLCVSEATDTYVDSACSYFQDSSQDPSNVGHGDVISVPVRNRFDALHDDRVNSHISYSEALKRPVLSVNDSCNASAVRISDRRKRNGNTTGQAPALNSQEARSKQGSYQQGRRRVFKSGPAEEAIECRRHERGENTRGGLFPSR